MKEFRFAISEKVTIWRDNLYQIECETEEEALAKMNELFEEPSYEDEDGFIQCDDDIESIEYLCPADTGGQPVKVLTYNDKNIREE